MAEEDTQEEYGYDSLLSEYNEVVSGEDKTVDSLYKMAELAYFMSNETDEDERKKWLGKGREHALNALKLAPQSLDVLRILCATTGRLAEESGMIDKMKLGFEFKDYLDRAIGLDDGKDADATYELRHMRGRFIHAIETLGTLERNLAKGFGAVPKVTIKQAIADLLKAEEVCSNGPENGLLLAKCYQVDGDKTNAVHWLEKAANGEEDGTLITLEYKNEAKKLLAELSRK